MSQLEFVEKTLPAVHIAEIIGEVRDQPEIATTIGPLFEQLTDALARSGIGLDRAAIAWYRPHEEGMEIAAAFPTALAQAPPRLAASGVQVEELEAADRAVTVLHHGGMETIGQTWQALATHVEDKGYRPVGRAREVYLHMPMDGDPATWVTELQQPVGG